MPRCRLSDRNHCALVCFASRFYSVMFCLRPFVTVTYDRLPTVCEPASLHNHSQDLPSRVLARIACRQTPTMQASIDPGLRTGRLGKKFAPHAGKTTTGRRSNNSRFGALRCAVVWYVVEWRDCCLQAKSITATTFSPRQKKDQHRTNNDGLRVTLCDWSCFHLHISSTTSAHPCNPIYPNNIHGQRHTNLTEIKKQRATSNKQRATSNEQRATSNKQQATTPLSIIILSHFNNEALHPFLHHRDHPARPVCSECHRPSPQPSQ